VDEAHYIIRGGFEGRERLRILSRVLRPTALALFHGVGIRPGMICLEAGCGGGDLAFDLARMVCPGGRVVGIDTDQIKLELARREAVGNELNNVDFRLADITQDQPEQQFDLVHARLLLTHLPNPDCALLRMRQALRPRGVVVLQDIDFRGHFCYPDSPALWRYVDLYTRTVQRRGGDASIGPRLPSLLVAAGFENIQMNVVQPAGMTGEVKVIAALTMENIADAVIAEGLASQAEIAGIVGELYEFARSPHSVLSLPRIVQAWGYKDSSEPSESRLKRFPN
jgi:ubiquinone/menaquinone biosynthesis C-methylase UbiE